MPGFGTSVPDPVPSDGWTPGNALSLRRNSAQYRDISEHHRSCASSKDHRQRLDNVFFVCATTRLRADSMRRWRSAGKSKGQGVRSESAHWPSTRSCTTIAGAGALRGPCLYGAATRAGDGRQFADPKLGRWTVSTATSRSVADAAASGRDSNESGHRMSGADPMYHRSGCGQQLAKVIKAADGCYRFERFNNTEVFAWFR